MVAPATLVVSASAPTYLKVRLSSAVGKQVFAGTMDPGQSHRFYAKRLWIAANDPSGLHATLDGRAVRLPAAVKRVGLVVTAAGVKASSGA
jgi:hypothetical protein